MSWYSTTPTDTGDTNRHQRTPERMGAPHHEMAFVRDELYNPGHFFGEHGGEVAMCFSSGMGQKGFDLRPAHIVRVAFAVEGDDGPVSI